MNEPQNNGLWLFLETLGRRRGFIILFVIAVTLVASIVSFLLPAEYDASALLLPPKEDSSPVVSMAEAEAGLGGIDLSAMSTSADVLVKILTSRTIVDRIIDRFGLMERYDVDTYIDAYGELMDRGKIVTTAEGLIFIGITDHDSQMAADIANSFVDELYRMNEEIVSSSAKEKIAFFGARLEKVKEDLAEARKNLETFQSGNRTVDFEQQTKIVMEQAINLRIALTDIDIELKAKELSDQDNSTELVRLRRRRAIVKAELDKLEYGGTDSSYFALPISSISSLKSQYEVYYSRVRVIEAMSKLLTQHLEQAKIQESGSFPGFSVIQRALKPERSFRPDRGLIIAIACLLSVVTAVFLAVLKDYLEKMSTASPENYDRVAFFMRSYFGWLPGIKAKPE